MSLSYADDKLVRGAELLDLYQEAGWSLFAARTPEQVEEMVRSATAFITAREGAKLVGFAAAISDRGCYAHVTEVLVRRSHRGRNVEAELLRRLLEGLSEVRTITVFAEPEAEALYRSLEFTPLAGAMILRRP